MQTTKTVAAALRDLGACDSGLTWLAGQPSLEAAWTSCERGDQLLEAWGRCVEPGSPMHRRLVAATCECVRLPLPHVQAAEAEVPRVALETAEAWTRGEATLEDLWKTPAGYADAADAADDAASAAAAIYYAAAADASGNTNAISVGAVGAAASAAVGAAASAAVSAAWQQTLRECADIVRRRITLDEFLGLLETARAGQCGP